MVENWSKDVFPNINRTQAVEVETFKLALAVTGQLRVARLLTRPTGRVGSGQKIYKCGRVGSTWLRWSDNSRIANSRSGQVMDWTSRGLVHRGYHRRLACLVSVLFGRLSFFACVYLNIYYASDSVSCIIYMTT